MALIVVVLQRVVSPFLCTAPFFHSFSDMVSPTPGAAPVSRVSSTAGLTSPGRTKKRRVVDEIEETMVLYRTAEEVARLSGDEVKFGLILVDTTLIKTLIRDAAQTLADVVMTMVEDDCRRVTRLVTSRYEALLAKCKEQPKVRALHSRAWPSFSPSRRVEALSVCRSCSRGCLLGSRPACAHVLVGTA